MQAVYASREPGYARYRPSTNTQLGREAHTRTETFRTADLVPAEIVVKFPTASYSANRPSLGCRRDHEFSSQVTQVRPGTGNGSVFYVMRSLYEQMVTQNTCECPGFQEELPNREPKEAMPYPVERHETF